MSIMEILMEPQKLRFNEKTNLQTKQISNSCEIEFQESKDLYRGAEN